MIKSIKAILAQDKEKFKVPRKVQDLIPTKNICRMAFLRLGISSPNPSDSRTSTIWWQAVRIKRACF